MTSIEIRITVIGISCSKAASLATAISLSNALRQFAKPNVANKTLVVVRSEWHIRALICRRRTIDYLLALSIESFGLRNVSARRLLVSWKMLTMVMSSRSLKAV